MMYIHVETLFPHAVYAMRDLATWASYDPLSFFIFNIRVLLKRVC